MDVPNKEALFDLVNKLQRTKAEGQTIELKAAHIFCICFS